EHGTSGHSSREARRKASPGSARSRLRSSTRNARLEADRVRSATPWPSRGRDELLLYRRPFSPRRKPRSKLGEDLFMGDQSSPAFVDLFHAPLHFGGPCLLPFLVGLEAVLERLQDAGPIFTGKSERLLQDLFDGHGWSMPYGAPR